MQEKEATPVEDIETVLPTAEPNKTTESANSNSLMEFMKETFKQMKEDNESNNKTLKKQTKEDNDTLNKKIEKNNET